ncbi:hypothetical protein GCM10022255_017950 [Dactylosporangium darangshiense]|uniref:Uncharacterized protein n=2 Tax=Dactylosporangium darangshiense TaxID=579108 RepID=A0ABP8D3V9_9ACTN
MSDQRGFAVDPQAVRAFAADLRHDLDVHLSSEKIQTLHIFSGAQMFGATTRSPVVRQAAADYYARLLELYDLLDVLLHNGAVMAQAAQDIADAYADADVMSQEQVDGAFGSAKRLSAADAQAVDPKTGRPV